MADGERVAGRKSPGWLESNHPSALQSSRKQIQWKYYLQSGAFQGVVDRPSIEQAASWCVDRALESIQFVYNEQGWTANQKFDQAILESLLSLGPSIEISERGWNRIDAIRLPTEALVIAWHLRQSENSSVDT
ncbi:MAG: hypothetical protein ACKN81_14860 [Pirellulaceae bacterium]